jgi:site-specific DNA-methyltransferase (adenine-specific)
MPNIELLNCDCMEYMATLPDKAFDLAIVDPPYGIDYLHSGGLGTNCKNKKHNRKWHDRKEWDLSIPELEYFNELFRVSKEQIIWGANYFTQYLPASMGWIFWDKGQDLSMSDGELAYTSFDRALRRVKINRGQLMIEGGTIHPTQKPVKLYKWILENYATCKKCKNAGFYWTEITHPTHDNSRKIECDCGGTKKILDTHLGSGSSAIAAHKMGFDFVGCELDFDYHAAAVKRFKEQTAQLSLL